MFRRRPLPVVSRAGAALFGLVIAVAAGLLVVPLWPSDQGLSAGDHSPRDLVARRGAQYQSVVLTQAARDQAAANVSPQLRPVDPNIKIAQGQALADALNEIRKVRQRSDLETRQEKLAELANVPAVGTITTAGLTSLLDLNDASYSDVEEWAPVALADLLGRPILESDDLAEQVAAYLQGVTTTFGEGELAAAQQLLVAFAVPNVEIDQQATEQARADARANVPPVIRTYTQGQIVAREGEVLDAATIEALRETGVIHNAIDYYDLGAGALLAGGLGLLLAVYLFLFQPVSAPPIRKLALVAITIVGMMAVARLALPAVTPDEDGQYLAYAIPVAAVAMIAASFADLQFAAVVSAATGLFTAFMAATSPDIAGASFVTPVESLELAAAHIAAGLAGATVVYRAERLSRYAVSALAVSAATAIVLVAFWMLDDPRPVRDLGWIAAASAASGIGAALLTVGLFVMLSHVLGVTTRLQLMELAHPGSHLLRRLQDEAPGTYHHSMMVGALAERAAEQIGADSLVVRAGAYYHDIGKLAQPQYYIENMLDGSPSPHDAMPPAESALRIREHITNGLEIARRNHLPAVIRDFIPQHHGTRLVVFFYRKALNAGIEVDPSEYRYAGPPPQSKESAIVMLADSCEAVVRASDERSPEQIAHVVDSVFAERLAEGQLDQCDITMRELQAVAASFKATLRAVYHQRIQYPGLNPPAGFPIAGFPPPEGVAATRRGD